MATGVFVAALLCPASLARAAEPSRPASVDPRADPDGAAGLRADVERIVSVEETTSDWFLDEDHQARILPSVLRSLCQSTEAARRAARDEAKAEVDRRGDPATIYARLHRRTAEVDDALHAARVLAAIDRGLASQVSCPFWIEPRHGFVGRQRDVDRLSFNVESGGVVQLRQSGEERSYGGGGGVRLLPGYTFGKTVKLLAGIEVAGGALLRFGDSSRFAVAWFPALPVVLRLHDGSVHYDFEATPVGYFTTDDTRVSYGFRGGFGVGISVLRTRSVIPWAGPAISYEHLFQSGGRESANVLRGGLRVGLVWDPFID